MASSLHRCATRLSPLLLARPAGRLAPMAATAATSSPVAARAAAMAMGRRMYAMIPGNPEHKRVDEVIKANDVVLFMKGVPEQPSCGFSRTVVQILDAQGVEKYAHVNVLEDEAARAAAKEYSDWPTFPQLYVKGEFVGGTDIVMGMFKSGELEKLMVEKGILKPETQHQV